jgi:hypothetical protein
MVPFQKVKAATIESVLVGYADEDPNRLRNDCQHLVELALASPLIRGVLTTLPEAARKSDRLVDLFSMGVRIGFQIATAAAEQEELEQMFL